MTKGEREEENGMVRAKKKKKEEGEKVEVVEVEA
jgi:hypothetical protein